MVSTASGKPKIGLANSHDDGEGAEIEFTKAPIIGSPGMLDEIGTIKYTGLDSNDAGQTYAQIKVQQGHYTHGSESGLMKIEVATQGTLRNVLSATGQHNVSEVDITLGYGANSHVHLSGDLILNPGNITIGGHSFGDIDIGSEFVDTDDHIMSSGAIKEKIESYGYVTSNDDVSVANLKTRLGSGFGSNAVSIGDSDDTVTIPGNLTVSGTTTTINTADLNVEDKNITLNYHATNDTSASADGAGITVQDAVNATTDARIVWDATNGRWNTTNPFFAKSIGSNRDEMYMNFNGAGSGSFLTHQSTTNGGNKTISFPNATGTLALTSDIPRSIMAARGESHTIFNLYKGALWFSANGYTLDWGLNSPPVLTDNSAANIVSGYTKGALVTAISNMKIYKVYFNMRWSSKVGGYNGNRSFQFAFHSVTHANDSAAKHTFSSQLVTTDHNGAYNSDRNHNLVFDFASGSGYTLSAGDSLHMFAKNTDWNSNTNIYSQMGGQIYIEYKYV